MADQKHSRAGAERAMTRERLQALLEAYGAALDRWPSAERGAAEALLARSESARAAKAETGRLDELLDRLQPPAPSPALAARLVALRVARAPRPAPIAALPALMRRPKAVAQLSRPALFVAASLLGLAVGIAMTVIDAQSPRGAAVDVTDFAVGSTSVQMVGLWGDD